MFCIISFLGLTIAARWNYLELLDLLLTYPNVNVNIATEAELKVGPSFWSCDENTALMYACEAGNTKARVCVRIFRLFKEDLSGS